MTGRERAVRPLRSVLFARGDERESLDRAVASGADSIVADLAYCYNGRFERHRSPAGGLSARLTLPLAT